MDLCFSFSRPRSRSLWHRLRNSQPIGQEGPSYRQIPHNAPCHRPDAVAGLRDVQHVVAPTLVREWQGLDARWRVQATGGNSVTDQPAEAASNERWQAEADEPLSDRPGIVASLLRYRLIVVVATLLGAVAGYGVAQQTPMQFESEASLILSDPGGPAWLGDNPLPSSDRGAYLAKQANIMTSSIVLRRVVKSVGSGQSVRELRERLKVRPRPTWWASRSSLRG